MNWTSRISVAFVAVFLGAGLPALMLAAQGPGVSSSSLLDTVSRGQDRPMRLKDEIRLGGDYLVGRGVAADPVQAAYWYRRAADDGDPDAQTEIGYFYLTGLGVKPDPAVAARWFERAMGAGSQKAKLNLAVLYLKGMGVSRDPGFGLELLRQVAHDGSAVAESYLGNAYYNGIGVPADHKAGEMWFEKAAKEGSAEGEFDMGSLYSVPADHVHDFEKAAKLLSLSARQGYVPAMHLLGLLLLNHPEIPQQPSEAEGLLSRAATAGNWRSSVALGIMNRDGRRTQKNIAAACRWFAIAGRQGGTDVDEYLRGDLATCHRILSATEEHDVLDASKAWMTEHRRKDLFVFGDAYRSGDFPSLEAFEIEPVQVSTDAGLSKTPE